MKNIPIWPHSLNAMFDLLKKRPLQKFHNVVFYTFKGSFKPNQAAYAGTVSHWDLVKTNNWDTLLFPQKIQSNYLLALPYTV